LVFAFNENMQCSADGKYIPLSERVTKRNRIYYEKYPQDVQRVRFYRGLTFWLSIIYLTFAVYSDPRNSEIFRGQQRDSAQWWSANCQQMAAAWN